MKVRQMPSGQGSRKPAAPSFCPACWRTIASDETRCRGCGADIPALSARTYAEKLLGALGHPIGEVRERAARLLGDVGGPEAREPLELLAGESPDPYLAAAALWGLKTLLERHPDLEPVDWKAFAGPDRPITVRVAAAEILKLHSKNHPRRHDERR